MNEQLKNKYLNYSTNPYFHKIVDSLYYAIVMKDLELKDLQDIFELVEEKLRSRDYDEALKMKGDLNENTK